MSAARERAWQILRLAAALGLAALLGGSALAASARFFWLGDLAASFRFQLGVAAVVVAALWLLARAPRLALVSAALGALHLAPVLALSAVAVGEPVPAALELRVATVNLRYTSVDAPRFLAWLEREQPDVLAVQELTPFWRDVLEGLAPRYPVRVLLPDASGEWATTFLGIGLLSRYPLRSLVRHDVAEAAPILEAELEVAGERLHVVAAHLPRPGMPRRTRARDAALRRLARDVTFGDASLVLGDLNATLYAPAFADLLAHTGLVSARRGHGRHATWRSSRVVPGLWLDLDHILVGSALVARELRTGPSVGSDHLPLAATLALARSGPAR